VNFRVVWMPPAEDRLAAVWLAAPDRNAVTRAAHEIDNVLELFPNSAGTAVFDNVREYSWPPLDVEYEVDDAGRVVYVLNVWSTASGRPPLAGG
jgi:hypothetical protein